MAEWPLGSCVQFNALGSELSSCGASSPLSPACRMQPHPSVRQHLCANVHDGVSAGSIHQVEVPRLSLLSAHTHTFLASPHARRFHGIYLTRLTSLYCCHCTIIEHYFNRLNMHGEIEPTKLNKSRGRSTEVDVVVLNPLPYLYLSRSPRLPGLRSPITSGRHRVCPPTAWPPTSSPHSPSTPVSCGPHSVRRALRMGPAGWRGDIKARAGWSTCTVLYGTHVRCKRTDGTADRPGIMGA